MLVKTSKVSLKVSFICPSDTDKGIDFMIPILSDTFDTVYNPTVLITHPSYPSGPLCHQLL